MKTTFAKDFFYKYISIQSVLMPEDYRLTYKEIMFLVECCVYHYEGNDLSNSKQLTKHLLDIKFFSRKSDVSLYKYKIGSKKWAKTGSKQFELPGILGKRKGDILNFNFSLELINEESISDRQDIE